MALKEDFTAAWNAKFPSTAVPEVSWPDTGKDTLKTVLKEHEAKVQQLRLELEKEEFIVQFLQGEFHRDGAGDQHVRGIQASVTGNGLDAEVPVPDSNTDKSLSHQEELWYKNVDLIEKAVEGESEDEDEGKRKLQRDDSVFSVHSEHEGMTGLRDFLGSLSSEGQAVESMEIVESSCKVFRTEPTVKHGDSGAHGTVPADHDNTADIDGTSTTESPHAAPVIVKSEHDSTKLSPTHTTAYKETNLDDISTTVTEKDGGVPRNRISLTDNEKALLLKPTLDRTDSASSVDSNSGERRKKPPVPTPRPSVKGPTLNKRASAGSTVEQPTTPIEEYKQEYYGVIDDTDKKRPASPSNLHRGATVQKSTPPLLKRRGRTVDMANLDSGEKDNDKHGGVNEQASGKGLKLHTGGKM